MSSTSELLPLPLTPVTAVSVPSGMRDVDVLEVVVAGADDLEAVTQMSDVGMSDVRLCDFRLRACVF